MLLQGTNGLHKGAFEVGANAHNLASGLHLSGKVVVCCYELIEWKTWNLHNNVVKSWLEAGKCFLCNGVLNFVKVVAKSNLSGNLCDWISCSLRCKSR